MSDYIVYSTIDDLGAVALNLFPGHFTPPKNNGLNIFIIIIMNDLSLQFEFKMLVTELG